MVQLGGFRFPIANNRLVIGHFRLKHGAMDDDQIVSDLLNQWGKHDSPQKTEFWAVANVVVSFEGIVRNYRQRRIGVEQVAMTCRVMSEALVATGLEACSVLFKLASLALRAEDRAGYKANRQKMTDWFFRAHAANHPLWEFSQGHPFIEKWPQILDVLDFIRRLVERLRGPGCAGLLQPVPVQEDSSPPKKKQKLSAPQTDYKTRVGQSDREKSEPKCPSLLDRLFL